MAKEELNLLQLASGLMAEAGERRFDGDRVGQRQQEPRNRNHWYTHAIRLKMESVSGIG